MATTAQSSDHPLLIEHKGKAYLSWLTREEGYRLVPLDDNAPSGAATAEARARERGGR
jgi:hypothetical protein